MSTKPLLKIGGAVLALSVGAAAAEEPRVPFVRMAELEIDPAQLEDRQVGESGAGEGGSGLRGG